MQRKVWLDKVYYDIGKQQYDFKVCGLQKKEDDEIISTKWRKYSEVIFPVDFDEDWKIQWINNREILPIEVVIDLEDKKTILDIMKRLERDDLTYYVYETGSKGFHIHIFFTETLTNEEKLDIVKRYGGDEMKSHQGTMIALENCPHWKTGRMKKEWKK